MLRFWFTILLTVCALSAQAQTGEDDELDSLINLYHGMSDQDTAKVRVCKSIAKMHFNIDSTLLWGHRLETLAVRHSMPDIQSVANYYIGWAYFYLDDYPNSLDYYTRSVEVARENGCHLEEGIAEVALVEYYRCVGEFSKSEAHSDISLDIFRSVGDSVQLIRAMRTRSALYTSQFIYELSEQTLLQCLHLDSLVGNQSEMCLDLSLLAECKQLQYDANFMDADISLLQECAMYALKAYSIANNLPDKYLSQSFIICSMVSEFFKPNHEVANRDRKIAEIYQWIQEEKSLSELIGSEESQVDVQLNLANYYSITGDLDRGRRILDSLETIYGQVGDQNPYINPLWYAIMYNCIARNDYKNAMQYWNKIQAERYKLISPDNAVRYTRLIENEKAEREKAEHALYERLMVTRYIGVIILISIVLGVLAVFYFHNRKHHRQLQEKNKSITDSIHYASLIQQAVLPTSEVMQNLFNDYFVVYKPLNIVAGDFYWANKTGDLNILVCADCTGHGVPGAFVSMLGVSLLNEVASNVEADTTASSVLNRLRTKMMTSLRQDRDRFMRGESTNMDGMDLAIVMIDYQRMTLQFAGANRPLWICRGSEVVIYKPDPMPIGVGLVSDRDFHNYIVPIQKGDMLYMFSDGITDQFGYTDEAHTISKQYSTKRLAGLLSGLCSRPLQEQKQAVEQAIESWRNGFRQIDDIILIGVRV